jgi:hypothetical protein
MKAEETQQRATEHLLKEIEILERCIEERIQMKPNSTFYDPLPDGRRKKSGTTSISMKSSSKDKLNKRYKNII